MARVVKTVLEVGTHQSPEGPVVVTPERIKRWADKHAEMTRGGLKFPVPWGHQRNAVPAYDGESAFLASKLNAGYFSDLRPSADGKRIESVIDAPGVELENGNLVTWAELPDGRKVKTAIGEVSAAITKSFRDGKGKVWDDVITHVALTPLPVWANQPGFQPLSLSPETVCLSLGATGWTLATGDKAVPKPDDDMDDDVDLDGAGDTPPGDAPPTDMPPAGPPAPAAGAGDQSFFQAKVLLQEHGISLPESTTAADGWQHLVVALTALKGKLTPKDGDEDPNAPASNPDDPNAPIIAENSPGMLSLIRDNPAAAALHASNQKLREKEQARAQKRIDRKLEKARAILPGESAAKLDAMGTVNLSLTRDGDLLEPKEFTRSEVLDFILAARPAVALTRTLSTAAAHPNPVQAAKQTAKAKDDELAKNVDFMAKSVGC